MITVSIHTEDLVLKKFLGTPAYGTGISLSTGILDLVKVRHTVFAQIAHGSIKSGMFH